MKADYSKIAHTYDQAHPGSEMAIERLLGFLATKAGNDQKIKLLDLGCGTGRFTSVLVSGGLLLNRYGAIEDILEDPEHKFFPEIGDIDRSRTPTKRQMEDWFKQIGFKKITSQTLEQQTFAHARDRFAAIDKRYISALWLISDSAFSKGLKALERYVTSSPDDEWLLTCKITSTYGKNSLCSHSNLQGPCSVNS